MIVRQVTESDAAQFGRLRTALDRETPFMMMEPGERRVRRSGNGVILVAEEDGALVGYLEVQGGAFRRNRHVGEIVVGMRGAYRGRGIGTRLFESAERWAAEHGLRRLELTVMTHNAAAIALYQKMGFAIEGTRRSSLLVDGSFVDEYYMAKLLPDESTATSPQ
jgi:RimJ/RimL family protein N-acetyltransferase